MKKAQSIWGALSEPRAVASILILYCAVHFLVRLFCTPNFTLDETEQMLFSQSLQWGYRFRHPPLITWLSWGTLEATHGSRDAFFLLKYVLMGAGLIAYFAAARIIIRDVKLAALATFALLTTFVMGYLPHIDLMHTVLLATMLAGFLWAAARVISKGSNGDYLLLGLTIGFGILSKYVFAMLPAAFAIAIIVTPRFRARIRLWPLIGALVLAALIVTPYAHWAAGHEYSLFSLAQKVAQKRGVAEGPLGWLLGAGNLVVALIEFVIPAALMFPLLYWRACKPLHGAGDDGDRDWLRVLEITMIAGALMMLAAVFFVGAASFKPRWMHQVAMPFAIWFFLRVKIAGASERAHKIFAGVALGFTVIVAIARVALFETNGPDCRRCREYWPMQTYAKAFREAGFERGTILAVGRDAGSGYDLAGNMRFWFPDSRVTTPGFPRFAFGPAIAGPCLIVWEGDGALPDAMRAYLADELGGKISQAAVRGDVEATLLTTKRLDRMNYILLPDGSCK
jgi:4-amino-4-deoxy-L-arabinose transferase-like glycosyltransferase